MSILGSRLFLEDTTIVLGNTLCHFAQNFLSQVFIYFSHALIFYLNHIFFLSSTNILLFHSNAASEM